MNLAGDYISINKFLYRIWWLRRHIVSPIGILKMYIKPITYFKLYLDLLKFRKSKNTNDFKSIIKKANRIYKLPYPVKRLSLFYSRNYKALELPLNMLVAEYLVTVYPNTDFNRIAELNKLNIPKESTLLTPKTIYILAGILVGLIFQSKPKVLQEMGVDFALLYSDGEIYKIIIGIILYILILILIILYGNQRKNSLYSFRNQCLKSCELISLTNDKLKEDADP